MAGSARNDDDGGRRVVGVDVGGSGIKAALVDIVKGRAADRIRVATPQPATPEAVAGEVARLVARFDGAGPFGCTVPAVVAGGVVRTAAHIDPAWMGTDAVALLSGATGRSCAVLNDADAAGLAEVRYGAARGHRGLVIVITVGTGLGTAVVHDGTLLPNAELGHLEIDGVDADDWASDAARTNEDLSWKRWAARFERYLARLHALLWPDLFVVGGGIAKHAEKFVERLEPPCELRIAELGNLAGIVGAAAAVDAKTDVERS
jgi:polyphosphate glucokinase